MSISEMKGAENRKLEMKLENSYSERIERGKKAALPHCLPATQGTVKLYLFLKR